MESSQIISRVDTPKGWVHHVTIVEKPNGAIRVCLDPSELNAALRRDFYQIPTLQDLASALSGAEYYTVLDLKDGFYHLELDEESSDVCSFSTPFGIFKFLRLPFGLNVSAEMFQKWNEFFFGDLEGVIIYIDDILIFGRTREEHDRRLKAVLRRAAEINAKFNPKKIQLRERKVKYMGHLFSAQGMEPDPERIKAIVEMDMPTDTKALQRFLGTVNYLRSFLPNLAETTAPLRELLKKGTVFKWLPIHSEAMSNIKKLITTTPVLSVFDERKEIVIQADASKCGLGACLLQDGKPVEYSSRSLSTCEQHYAQVEKEFLAILFACKKYHQYIYGREVKVQTDHKPLVALMEKPVSKIHASRLQRIKMKLSKYHLKLCYVPGKYMYLADFLSRAYIQSEEKASTSLDYVVHTINVSEDKAEEFRRETKNDPVLSGLLQLYRDGWPNDRSKLPEDLRYYWQFRDKLYEDGGLLFMEERIFVPVGMRRQMLSLLHETHGGITKTKKRAATIFFWPTMNRDIEDTIAKCNICEKFHRSNIKEPLIPHPVPERCFEQLGCDFFEFGGKNYLAIADYFSKWIHVAETKGKSAREVCEAFRRAFCIYGIPAKVVCDNNPFNSGAVKAFCDKWKCKIVTSSPNYPQSNGFSERCVQTIKRMMRKCAEDNVDFYYALLEYNNTPAAGLSASPAQILMGRILRSKLPVTEKSLAGAKDDSTRAQLEVNQRKYKRNYDKSAHSRPEFEEGDLVLAQDPATKRWVRGEILRKLNEPRSYVVRTNSASYRRNSRFIKKRNT